MVWLQFWKEWEIYDRISDEIGSLIKAGLDYERGLDYDGGLDLGAGPIRKFTVNLYSFLEAKQAHFWTMEKKYW
jgi:hypothetical protein